MKVCGSVASGGRHWARVQLVPGGVPPWQDLTRECNHGG